ncbi:hypothetical protein KAR91_18325 [Candidatus Pacearchaeota archaeon]|nr:hypothetical protein [Candidatus Pacearchaeota archaeon]
MKKLKFNIGDKVWRGKDKRYNGPLGKVTLIQSVIKEVQVLREFRKSQFRENKFSVVNRKVIYLVENLDLKSRLELWREEDLYKTEQEAYDVIINEEMAKDAADTYDTLTDRLDKQEQ